MFDAPAAVGDKVYIKDKHFEWLPAVVVEVSSDDEEQVRLKLDLPESWKRSTYLAETMSDVSSETYRWVNLKDYHNHQLPLRGEGRVRDLSDLPFLHEASVLYQIKQRFIEKKPYTKVGDIVVAVNPCQWVDDLYNDEAQVSYALNLVWKGKIRKSSYCISSAVSNMLLFDSKLPRMLSMMRDPLTKRRMNLKHLSPGTTSWDTFPMYMKCLRWLIGT